MMKALRQFVVIEAEVRASGDDAVRSDGNCARLKLFIYLQNTFLSKPAMPHLISRCLEN